MTLGRYQLGSEVPLLLLTRNASGAPAAPDACPKADVYGPAAKAALELPPLDAAGATGLFQGGLYLDGAFAEGAHLVVFRWLISGTTYQSWAAFEVLPGGDATGQVISLYDYRRPHADHLVQQRTGGTIHKGRNPRP